MEAQPTDRWLKIATLVAKDLATTIAKRDKDSGIPDEEIQALKKSGLLPLVVPKEFGGIGANWPEAMEVIRILAKIDSSTAQLYGYHLLLTVLGQVGGTPEQAASYYQQTAQHNYFWGNAINVRDLRLTIQPDGNHFRVNGTKTFCTGAVVADRRVCAALSPDSDIPLLFVLPKEREGMSYNDDWDTMGQRRTASGSFTFANVLVKHDEILGPPENIEMAFSTFLGVLGSLILTHIHLGVAMGAFEAAQIYTTHQSRPWLTSGVEQATQDSYILNRYGDLWSQLQGALAFTNQVTEQVQIGWQKGQSLTHSERAELAISVASAKVLSVRVGLSITQDIFELMGARSTSNRYDFGRYLRDMRTFTIHDPIDYKLREIGNWILNKEAPFPTPYS